jgi:hypothetical protein
MNCDVSCVGCVGTKNDQCKACDATKGYIESSKDAATNLLTCSCKVGQGFFLETVGKTATSPGTQRCSACDVSCLSCVGTGPDFCVTCKNTSKQVKAIETSRVAAVTAGNLVDDPATTVKEDETTVVGQCACKQTERLNSDGNCVVFTSCALT